MTDPQNPESTNESPFSRRDVLKTAGGIGAFSALGAEPAIADRPKQRVIGTEPGRADIARRGASEVSKVIDMKEVGMTVVGRWPEEALDALENNSNIRYIEERKFVQPDQQTRPWGVDRIDAEFAHAAGDTGSGIDVAILDTGIDADHPDLDGNLGDGNGVDDCDDSNHPDGNCDEDWDDTDGHGTAVAGIVGAIDNTEDVIGVSHEVTLHAVKVFPSGAHEDVEEGLKWVADQGYDVANMSLSGGGDTGPLSDGVEYADNRDVVLVGSAGNDGPCTDCVNFPAAYDEVIAVSNIEDDDTLFFDSNQGPEIDLGAPGEGVTSTAIGGGTTGFGGTSGAAPHVAAAAAQLLANGTSPGDVRDELKNNAEDIGLSNNEQGAGLLDLAAALGHDSANDLTEVETRFAADIQYTEAELNGRLTELTGNDSAEVFFQYRQKGTAIWTKVGTETLNSTGGFAEPVTGLEEDTTYEFRAGVTVEESTEGWSSTEHGEIEEFDTVDNPDPTAAFEHDPDVPDPGDVLEFDGSMSDPGEVIGVDEDDSIVSYEWDFEDDGMFDDSGETVTHSYSEPGDVTVRLRVTDEFDQTDETTKTLRVNAPPEAAFEHSPTVPNEGQDVEFDASDSMDPDGDIDTYEWEFGDGTTETTTDPVTVHNYGPVDDGNWGEFDVTLTVTDNDDATDEVTQTIRINAYPRATFDVVTDPPVRNESVEFDASGSTDPNPGGSIVEYEWDFGDGTTETTTNPTVEHTFTTGGKHTVTLRVTDDDGASHDDLSVHEETFTVYIRVAISIQPNGTGENSINPNRSGDIPAAVLHTSAFDSPNRLDHSSVHFGDPDDVGFDTSTDPFTPEGGATPSHSGGHVEDVDDDGDGDSLFHFPTRDADFESDDSEGKLVGLTNDGIPVFGTDSVNIVGGGGGGS